MWSFFNAGIICDIPILVASVIYILWVLYGSVLLMFIKWFMIALYIVINFYICFLCFYQLFSLEVIICSCLFIVLFCSKFYRTPESMNDQNCVSKIVEVVNQNCYFSWKSFYQFLLCVGTIIISLSSHLVSFVETYMYFLSPQLSWAQMPMC
mgnify:CR=1 FL=1